MEVEFKIIRKETNYTCIDNGIFKDTLLSAKAKGVLCTLLSLPKDWKFSIEGIASLFSDGETSIRSALQELEQARYLKRERVYESGKISGWKYTIYEVKQDDEILDVENQHQDNQALLNTNIYKITNSNKVNNTITKVIVESEPKTSTLVIPKKKNLFEKCVDLVNEVTENESLRNALVEYLKLRLSITDKPMYFNQWKALLKKLSTMKGDKVEIVNNSIEHAWLSFYEITEKRQRNVFGEHSTVGSVDIDEEMIQDARF